MLYWSHRTMGQLIIRIQQNSTLGSLIWSSWSHHCRTLAHCDLENDWSSCLRDLIPHGSATPCQKPNKKAGGSGTVGFFLPSFQCLCYRFPGKPKINFRNWKKKSTSWQFTLNYTFIFLVNDLCSEKLWVTLKRRQTKSDQNRANLSIHPYFGLK